MFLCLIKDSSSFEENTTVIFEVLSKNQPNGNKRQACKLRVNNFLLLEKGFFEGYVKEIKASHSNDDFNSLSNTDLPNNNVDLYNNDFPSNNVDLRNKKINKEINLLDEQINDKNNVNDFFDFSTNVPFDEPFDSVETPGRIVYEDEEKDVLESMKNNKNVNNEIDNNNNNNNNEIDNIKNSDNKNVDNNDKNVNNEEDKKDLINFEDDFFTLVDKKNDFTEDLI